MNTFHGTASSLLQGKKVFITGASRGIGLAIAECFAKAGAELYLNALDQTRLEAEAARIKEQFKVPVYAYPFDVSDKQAVKHAFQNFQQEHKTLDVLINNAGIMLNSQLSMASDQLIEKSFGTNVYGAIYCAQYASRIMARNKQGSIINLGSHVGDVGHEGQSIYAASKAAVIGLTKSWAKEFSDMGIRVNAISPGMIKTDLLQPLSEETIQDNLKKIPLQRLGLPEEVAKVALFLASDLSSYMTGQTLSVDGGMLG